MHGKKWSSDILLATTEEIEAALPTAEIIFKKSDGQPRRALLAQAVALAGGGAARSWDITEDASPLLLTPVPSDDIPLPQDCEVSGLSWVGREVDASDFYPGAVGCIASLRLGPQNLFPSSGITDAMWLAWYPTLAGGAVSEFNELRFDGDGSNAGVRLNPGGYVEYRTDSGWNSVGAPIPEGEGVLIVFLGGSAYILVGDTTNSTLLGKMNGVDSATFNLNVAQAALYASAGEHTVTGSMSLDWDSLPGSMQYRLNLFAANHGWVTLTPLSTLGDAAFPAGTKIGDVLEVTAPEGGGTWGGVPYATGDGATVVSLDPPAVVPAGATSRQVAQVAEQIPDIISGAMAGEFGHLRDGGTTLHMEPGNNYSTYATRLSMVGSPGPLPVGTYSASAFDVGYIEDWPDNQTGVIFSQYADLFCMQIVVTGNNGNVDQPQRVYMRGWRPDAFETAPPFKRLIDYDELDALVARVTALENP